MKILFISDLHLDPKRPDIQKCFNDFIHSCLITNQTSHDQKIHSLYILGDLFEVWLGDDISIALYKDAIELLKTLSDSGTHIYIMHGNRDFLLGSEFESASACQLIPDSYTITLPASSNSIAKKILLSHGDNYCTDDKDYMQLRAQLRAPNWQQRFLAKPSNERITIAQNMRQQSQHYGQHKSTQIMDVNQEAIEQALLKHQADILIHGHTHQPATHHFKLNDKAVTRVVLPDWQPNAKAFTINLSNTIA